MHSVLISLASNHDQQKHLSRARKALAEVLFDAAYTAEVWTEPIGMPQTGGIRYLNQLVRARTPLDADSLALLLKQTEERLGRNAEARSRGLVPIDLDLLQHDDRRYHLRDWERPYVKDLLELF